MPFSSAHAAAIADVAATLTPARIAAMKSKTDAEIADWSTIDEQLADLDAAIADEKTALATATANNTTYATQEATKATSITTLQTGIASLQQQIADATAGVATQADVAERDEIVALAAEVGVTIP